MDKIIVESCRNCVFLHELHSDYFCKISNKPIGFIALHSFKSDESTVLKSSEIPLWCELRSGVVKVGLKP